MLAFSHINEATITSQMLTVVVYRLIKDQRYTEAITCLREIELTCSVSKNNRALLSLLAYCYYQQQDYINASDCYEQLSKVFPRELHYHLYYAQSLYQAGLHDTALKIAHEIDHPDMEEQLHLLKACISYARKSYNIAQVHLDCCNHEDVNIKVNCACMLFQQEKYREALMEFTYAARILENEPRLIYNMAVCHYKLKHFTEAQAKLSVIITRANKNHPELNLGLTTMGVHVSSVGNSRVLQESAVVETLNLQAAIKFMQSNYEGAMESMTDLPPRSESELDHYTLHNLAIVSVSCDPQGCDAAARINDAIKKLQFLLQQPSFPAETFANLLLLYVKYEHYDMAADTLAANQDMATEFLTSFQRDFLSAVLNISKMPSVAFTELEHLAKAQQEKLTKLDDMKLFTFSESYEEVLNRYVVLSMQQAKILWDRQKYNEVEKLFHKTYLLCKDHKVWKMNSAHVLYMLGDKYKESASIYASILEKQYHDILSVPAAVFANLCVSYVMTSRNEIAEELLRKLEKEEERLAYHDPDRKTYHLCIVNMVIGTLYCTKGNYEFGIGQIIKSVEPIARKLGTETWWYIKRCFLALLEAMAHQLVYLSNSVLNECMHFLTRCEASGRHIKAKEDQPLETPKHKGLNTVTYEARLLKALLVQLI